MKKLAVLFTILLLLSGGSAMAQTAPLSAAEAANFVGAIPDMEKLSEKMRAEGKDAVLESSVRPKPGDKDFRPYTKGADVLKQKFPADYALLEQTVTQHGFTGANDWAAAGDKVMMAYLAAKMEGPQYKNLEMMANVPPEVKAKLPPQVASQIDQAVTVIGVAKQVPAGNKEIVRPHIATIDGWLAREQKKLGLSNVPATTKKSATSSAQTPKSIP